MLSNLSSFGVSGWLLFILGSVFLILSLNYMFRSRFEMVNKRIEDMKLYTEGTEEEKLLSQSLFKRIYIMLEEKMTMFLEKYYAKGSLAPLKVKLLQAGNYEMEPMQFRAKVMIFAMAGAALGILLKDIRIIVIFTIAGYWYPQNKLKEAINKRQMKIKNEIPDFLDLLAATAPSSKNLEDAIRKVCDRTEGEVTKEFTRALEEVNAGRKMRDALSDMSGRCGVKEIHTLVSQINQSEVFGTGVEKTLISQAEKIRKLKKVMAEIKARKASVMLLLPSLFLLFTILIMIAGPHIVSFITSMGAMS